MVPPIPISQIGTQYTNPLFFMNGTTSFARRKADFTLMSKICINKRPKKIKWTERPGNLYFVSFHNLRWL